MDGRFSPGEDLILLMGGRDFVSIHPWQEPYERNLMIFTASSTHSEIRRD